MVKMADNNDPTISFNKPRLLTDKETVSTLNQWKATAEVYYSREKCFEGFFDDGVTWNMSAAHFGQETEADGLRRPAAKKARHLQFLLTLLSGHSPYEHLQNKILHETSNMQQVWDAIYETFSCKQSNERFLDFNKMTKLPMESYLTFHERLAGHIRHHLAPAGARAGPTTAPVGGDTMTVTLKDLVASVWLQRIDPRLPEVIQTEFHTRLENGARLSALVPTIATQIDALLQRYEGGAPGAAGRVRDGTKPGLAPTVDVDDLVDAAVRKLNFGSASKNQQRGGNNRRDNFPRRKPEGRQDNRGGAGRFPSRGESCPYCSFLSSAFKMKLSTDHSPRTCAHRPGAVSLIQAAQQVDQQEDSELSPMDAAVQAVMDLENNGEAEENEPGTAERVKFLCSKEYLQSQAGVKMVEKLRDTIRVKLVKNEEQETQHADKSNFISSQSNKKLSPTFDFEKLKRSHGRIRKILLPDDTGPNPRKAKSPTLLGQVNGLNFVFVIDEGAEMSILDEAMAKHLDVEVDQTLARANAANESPMEMVGQTAKDFIITVKMDKGPVQLNLGKVPVVRNLGCSLLLGEPSKADNKIVTMAYEQNVIIRKDGKVYTAPYYKQTKRDFQRIPGVKWLSEEVRTLHTTVLRVPRKVWLGPGDKVSLPINEMQDVSKGICITPTEGNTSWIRAGPRFVKDQQITIKNISNTNVKLERHAHVAKVFSCKEFDEKKELDPDKLIPEPENGMIDWQQYLPPKGMENDDFDENLKQVQTDPDNRLTPKMREKFKNVTRRYKKLFTKRPGKYNGTMGAVSNNLTFSGVPPRNEKVRVPNYSKDMNNKLADRMDELEDMGVLAFPESIGVEVAFLSPSFLIPKDRDVPEDKLEYRLLTDFSHLNTFIKKPVSLSQTISKARLDIARANYFIAMDFSNFFYQSGMRRRDIQYLGTVHPYKGVMVYTCLPQGLKGSSEWAYEKLTRIFADMQKGGRCTKMADGFFILAQTPEELLKNYEEALKLTQQAGLTFKPAKVVIAPRETVLFGWQLKDGMWAPTKHVVSALARAEYPQTITMLRSFIGAFKQISHCVEGYATLLNPFDTLQGGKAGGEKIIWSDTLRAQFDDLKKAAGDPAHIAVPAPSDQLRIYSDFSTGNKAGGARLEILRKQPDGSTKILPGGYYSMTFHKYKRPLNPCDGECMMIRAALDFWQQFILESQHQTIHYTDNRACYLAWERARRGAVSTSARINTFLAGLSALPVTLKHRAGKLLQTADYLSRHPTDCDFNNCDVCKFSRKWENVSDDAEWIRGVFSEEISRIGAVTVEDVLLNRKSLPYINRQVWLNVQKKDPVLVKLQELINSGQSPEKKKTGNENTRLKLLHTLYTKGKLRTETDGLITVETQSGQGIFSGNAVVVPPDILQGLITILHLKLNHPGITAAEKMLERHFYAPAWRKYLKKTHEECYRCKTLKNLSPLLAMESTSESSGFGSKWAADVIERGGQKLFVITEDLSLFTQIRIIHQQNVETFRETILSTILPYISESGAVVRTDNAAAFVSLNKEGEDKNSLLFQYNISIQPGRAQNVNKNPVAERMNRTVSDEILRAFPDNKVLNNIEVEILARQINGKIHYNSYSSREILLRRAMTDNATKNIDDKELARLQIDSRTKNSEAKFAGKAKTHKQAPDEQFSPGDVVHCRSEGSKLAAKQTYLVVRSEGESVFVKKMGSQMRNKDVEFKRNELVKIYSQGGYSEEEQCRPEGAACDTEEQQAEEENNEAEEEFAKKPSSNMRKKATNARNKANRNNEIPVRARLDRKAKLKPKPDWTSLIDKVITETDIGKELRKKLIYPVDLSEEEEIWSSFARLPPPPPDENSDSDSSTSEGEESDSEGEDDWPPRPPQAEGEDQAESSGTSNEWQEALEGQEENPPEVQQEDQDEDQEKDRDDDEERILRMFQPGPSTTRQAGTVQAGLRRPGTSSLSLNTAASSASQSGVRQKQHSQTREPVQQAATPGQVSPTVKLHSLATSPLKVTRGLLQRSFEEEQPQLPPQVGDFTAKLKLYNMINIVPSEDSAADNDDDVSLEPGNFNLTDESNEILQSTNSRNLRTRKRINYKDLHNYGR